MCSEKYSGSGNPMYGVHRFGEESPTYGKKWTEEEKARASDAQKKRYLENPESFKKPVGSLCGEKNPMYGKQHSNITKEKISEKAKERGEKLRNEKMQKWISEEHCCEICGRIMLTKYGAGRFCSKECVNIYQSINEEKKMKLSESLKGKAGHAWTEEQRENIIKKLTGQNRSEETKKKISESKKGKPSQFKGIPRPEDVKKKMSDGRKGKHYELLSGKNNGMAKKVINIDTGEVFETMLEASKSINHKSITCICACCRGKSKTAGGYHWRYADEVEQENLKGETSGKKENN